MELTRTRWKGRRGRCCIAPWSFSSTATSLASGWRWRPFRPPGSGVPDGSVRWRASQGGSSQPDQTFVNPVNIGRRLLVAGMFGMIGLAAATTVFVGPVIEVGRWLPLRAWLNPGCSPVTLVAVLLIVSLGDALLNSTVV